MSGATNNSSEANSGYFSLVTSSAPKYVGKRYFPGPDGKLAKKGVASISAGQAVTIEATAVNLVAALKKATKSENQVILLDSFIGALPSEPDEINIVTRERLEGLLDGPIRAPAQDTTGYFNVGGAMVSARLNLLMTWSGWVLFDGDLPEGMPDEWKRLSLPERLDLFEAVLPGVSTCLRIEYRGSSARVVNGSGEKNPGADPCADADQRRIEAEPDAGICPRQIGCRRVVVPCAAPFEERAWQDHRLRPSDAIRLVRLGAGPIDLQRRARRVERPRLSRRRRGHKDRQP